MVAADAVADAWGGLDRLWVAELAAQAADCDLDGFGERVGVLVPYLPQQVFGRQEAWCGPQQRFEDGEFLG